MEAEALIMIVFKKIKPAPALLPGFFPEFFKSRAATQAGLSPAALTAWACTVLLFQTLNKAS